MLLDIMRNQVSVVRRLDQRLNHRGGGEPISERINSSQKNRIKLRNNKRVTSIDWARVLAPLFLRFV